MEKEIKVLENDFIKQVDGFIQNAISSANSAVSSIIVSTYCFYLLEHWKKHSRAGTKGRRQGVLW